MRKDLLSQLHLPKIDVTSLQEIVTQNSNRLGLLLAENDDFVRRNKIVPPGYKGISVSMVSDYYEPKFILTNVRERIDGICDEVVRRGVIFHSRNSLERSGMGADSKHEKNPVFENLYLPAITPDADCVTLAGSLGWHNGDKDRNTVEDTQSHPMRLTCKEEFSPFWDFDIGQNWSLSPNEFSDTHCSGNCNDLVENDLLCQNISSGNGKTECLLPEISKDDQDSDSKQLDPNSIPLWSCSSMNNNLPCNFRRTSVITSSFSTEKSAEDDLAQQNKITIKSEEEALPLEIPDALGNANSLLSCSDNFVESVTEEQEKQVTQEPEEVCEVNEVHKAQDTKDVYEVGESQDGQEASAVEESQDAQDSHEVEEFQDGDEAQDSNEAEEAEDDLEFHKAQKCLEAKIAQLITPKKTNDITKIKGWRRKQFFVEKPTTVEFFRYANGKGQQKIDIKELGREINEEPGKVENAFVCDSLDEFLDRDAELRINYEIPHLYAEVGIKLTSDEIASKPELSREYLKDVESRYCVPVPVPADDSRTNVKKTEGKNKGVKRVFEEDTGPFEVLKTDESNPHSRRTARKHTGKVKLSKTALLSRSAEEDAEKSETEVRIPKETASENSDDFALTAKLLGLVVYPSCFKPLHPMVQLHLRKLRSYHTKIDKHWANFAVSALVTNNKKLKRNILPVYCCTKTKRNPSADVPEEVRNVVGQLVDSSPTETEVKVTSGNVEAEDEKHLVERTSQTFPETKKRELTLKECRVVLDHVKVRKDTGVWCMEHDCYNCRPCGLIGPKKRTAKRQPKRLKLSSSEEEEDGHESEERAGEPATSFSESLLNSKVSSFLTKKIRGLKFRDETFNNIDCLRVLRPNAMEFILLNFVRQSFLNEYVSIWYLQPESSSVRSKAFLTFSQVPPVANAINLKSSVFSLQSLPKVIREIVSGDSMFEGNEYAILRCDGKVWEIHGSLNLSGGKSQKNVDQIFTSTTLPELKELQEISLEILKMKATKWWVFDLSQDFKQIEFRAGPPTTVVTRRKFLGAVKSRFFGFRPLRRGTRGRVFGVYLSPKLLPFVLIGPYLLLESHDLVIKNDFSTVPFLYYGEEKVTNDCPLKFFINSVLKEMEESHKKLEGMWLYDKISLDSTCYLEVTTTNWRSSLPKQLHSINIEHGYSLNSLTSSLTSPSGMLKSKINWKSEIRRVMVYVYFDIFDLGYLDGVLHLDNSVVINHPLDDRMRVKSHRIGDWFINIIKRRIQFIPKNLPLRWFVTKYKEDLRNRSPFNKYYLGGAYLLCKAGLFYKVEMSDEKIEELGLDRNEVLRALGESQVINEMKELQNLADVLQIDKKANFDMYEVLQMAIKEIKNLEKLENALKMGKRAIQNKNLNLLTTHIKVYHEWQAMNKAKRKARSCFKALVTKAEFIEACRCGLRCLKNVTRDGERGETVKKLKEYGASNLDALRSINKPDDKLGKKIESVESEPEFAPVVIKVDSLRTEDFAEGDATSHADMGIDLNNVKVQVFTDDTAVISQNGEFRAGECETVTESSELNDPQEGGLIVRIKDSKSRKLLTAKVKSNNTEFRMTKNAEINRPSLSKEVILRRREDKLREKFPAKLKLRKSEFWMKKFRAKDAEDNRSSFSVEKGEENKSPEKLTAELQWRDTEFFRKKSLTKNAQSNEPNLSQEDIVPFNRSLTSIWEAETAEEQGIAETCPNKRIRPSKNQSTVSPNGFVKLTGSELPRNVIVKPCKNVIQETPLGKSSRKFVPLMPRTLKLKRSFAFVRRPKALSDDAAGIRPRADPNQVPPRKKIVLVNNAKYNNTELGRIIMPRENDREIYRLKRIIEVRSKNQRLKSRPREIMEEWSTLENESEDAESN